MSAFTLTARADLERAAALMARMNAPVLPMIRAAADGLIALVSIVDPKAKWPERDLAKFKRPVLLVIGDDMEPERPSRSPAGWRCARMLRSWAPSAMIHGSGGEAAHYRLAVATTLTAGRFALIETNSAYVKPWIDFLSPMPLMTIVPRSGSHPVAPSRGDLH